MDLDEEELKATKGIGKTADEMFEELGYKRKDLGIYNDLNMLYEKEDGSFVNFIPRS